jgi:hypothetical protein
MRWTTVALSVCAGSLAFATAAAGQEAAVAGQEGAPTGQETAPFAHEAPLTEAVVAQDLTDLPEKDPDSVPEEEPTEPGGLDPDDPRVPLEPGVGEDVEDDTPTELDGKVLGAEGSPDNRDGAGNGNRQNAGAPAAELATPGPSGNTLPYTGGRQISFAAAGLLLLTLGLRLRGARGAAT